jgi:hypothetical protein
LFGGGGELENGGKSLQNPSPQKRIKTIKETFEYLITLKFRSKFMENS